MPSNITPLAEVEAWDLETDILVVGAGGCGLTAALVASELGNDVLVVERDRRPICNTGRSSGMIPASGTAIQRAAGIEETPADLVARHHGQESRRFRRGPNRPLVPRRTRRR